MGSLFRQAPSSTANVCRCFDAGISGAGEPLLQRSAVISQAHRRAHPARQIAAMRGVKNARAFKTLVVHGIDIGRHQLVAPQVWELLLYRRDSRPIEVVAVPPLT